MARPETTESPDDAPPRAALAEIISRDGLIVALCLAVLAGLAWWWLFQGAGMPASGPMAGMDGMDSMPGMAMPSMATTDVWSLAYLGATFIMWAVMMVAMMLPSAAPMILLHELFSRRNGLGPAATWAFTGSYIALWTLFALVAALAQAALIGSGLVGEATLALGDHRAMAALLMLAAAWQISPLKRLCLTQCQTPFRFLIRHWQPGVDGAIRMGLRHGLYCIGCCWVLMALLFVGGVMNLAWIAVLAIVVLAEKYAPADLRADRLIAALLALAAAVIWWQGA